jgi:hypothetical protein
MCKHSKLLPPFSYEIQTPDKPAMPPPPFSGRRLRERLLRRDQDHSQPPRAGAIATVGPPSSPPTGEAVSFPAAFFSPRFVRLAAVLRSSPAPSFSRQPGPHGRGAISSLVALSNPSLAFDVRATSAKLSLGLNTVLLDSSTFLALARAPRRRQRHGPLE